MVRNLFIVTCLAAAVLLAGCMSKDQIDQHLISAVMRGDLGQAEEMLDKGGDLYPEKFGQPLLNTALTGTMENQFPMIKLLLEHHADPNQKDKGGRTPLMYVLDYGNRSPEVLELLLKHGANINNTNARGETLLMLAITQPIPDSKYIDLLLKHKADPNIQNQKGETALHQTVTRNWHDAEIVRLLLAAGAKVNLKDNTGQIALNKAFNCDPNIIITLVNAGSDLKNLDSLQETPLLMAARWGKPAAARAMIDKGADVNARDKWGTTTLFKVAGQGDLALVKMMVDKGANVNEVNQDCFTPLHFAAAEFRTDVIEYLIAKGARSVKNKEGQTPLDYANAHHQPTSPEEKQRKEQTIKILSKKG